MIRTIAALLWLALCPASLWALDLPAGAQQLSQRDSPLDSYALPTGAFAEGAVPAVMTEGRVDRQTWRISGEATTLQLLGPLRDQLQDAGYVVLFECADLSCGGFDFRFGTEVVPAPDMHVDIRDFRFLSATRNNGEALSLLVSRYRSSAYLQVIRVGPGEPLPDPLPTTPETEVPESQPKIPPMVSPELLIAQGHLVLDDLVFLTGAIQLGEGPYDSLNMLGVFLADNPEYRIALVGHTDSVGDLQSNIALSRQRAEAVRARLIAEYGAAADRVSAEGMGYLAPRASNLTPEGREANRRVEVILLPNN